MTLFADDAFQRYLFACKCPGKMCWPDAYPASAQRALLVDDAAGIVSPVTAGGIHAALKHGLAAGHAIADYLTGRSVIPAVVQTIVTALS